MAYVELLGPRELLAEVLEFLQERAVLELREPEGPAARAVVRGLAAARDAPEREARLLEVIRRADALRARLPAAPVPSGAQPLGDRLAELERTVAGLEGRRQALAEEAEAIDRFVRVVVALAPLDLPADLEEETDLHALVLREDGENLALLRAEVRRVAGEAAAVVARDLDDGTTAVLLAVPRARSRALSVLLHERGVEEVRLPQACAGRPLLDVLLHLARRAAALPREQAEVDAALEGLAREVAGGLAAAARDARAALERLRAQGRCGETRFAFLVAGYMPAEDVDRLRAAAEARFGERVVTLARAPGRARWDEVPVVLRNGPAIRPFQHLLALVPLPRYGSVDPTPWLAVFFPLLFGLVLGDVAFGVVGVAASLLVRGRGWGGRTGRELSTVALACSVAAIVFGVLFGEALGQLGEHLGLHPIILDRRSAFLGLLALALCVGGVHVAVGTALGVVAAAREGHRREAVARGARLATLGAAAAVAAALAGVTPAGLRPALAAGGAALAVAVLAGGPLSLLDVVLALGNVLSYARLMALGLASVMLAEVANLVAGTLEPAAAGVTLAVLLHAVNFTLGLLSPTIAALRLHYVEFFEKFYVEGGAPHRPLAVTGS
jgi:V/A-type H+-transporting ATPase subunit I